MWRQEAADAPPRYRGHSCFGHALSVITSRNCFNIAAVGGKNEEWAGVGQKRIRILWSPQNIMIINFCYNIALSASVQKYESVGKECHRLQSRPIIDTSWYMTIIAGDWCRVPIPAQNAEWRTSWSQPQQCYNVTVCRYWVPVNCRVQNIQLILSHTTYK